MSPAGSCGARRTARRVTALLIAAGALGLAGCGEDTVDTEQVERGIDQQLSTPAAAVSSVNCPDDVKSEEGATFTCSVSWSNGAKGQVKVTQQSGGSFAYQAVDGSVTIPGASVDKAVEQTLATEGYPNAAVSCPDTVTVEIGTSVTCGVTGAGGQASGTVTFMFSSASGDVDASSVETQ